MNIIRDDEEFCPYCGFHIKKYLYDIKKECPQALLPGTRIGSRYLIGVHLGHGGFGITYMGYDQWENRKVAVKEYFPTDIAARRSFTDGSPPAEGGSVLISTRQDVFQNGLARFEEEAKSLLLLNSIEGIVSVHDFVRANNTGYIVMEYLPGKSLLQILNERYAPMDQKEVLTLMNPVMDSLIQLHAQNMIHRDISPDNLIMDEKGRLVLIDFGAAKDVDVFGHTVSVTLKHSYAPIEQYSSHGKQGPWTDVYAFCSTLYYMLTGVKVQQSTNRVARDEVRTLEEMRANVSGSFSRAIARGLAIKPADRFQNVKALKNALNAPDVPSSSSGGGAGQVIWTGGSGSGSGGAVISRGGVSGGGGGGVSSHGGSRGGSGKGGKKKKKDRKKKSGIGLEAFVIGLVLVAVVLACVAAYIIFTRDTGPSQGTDFDGGTYVTIKSKSLNDDIPIYTEPGGSNILKYRLSEAIRVHVTGRSETGGKTYYQIEFCGLSGWVRNDMLKKLSDDDTYFQLNTCPADNMVFFNEERQYNENMQPFSLYSDPDPDTGFYTDIDYGDTLQITEIENGFGKTSYAGYEECWVNMAQVNYYESDYWKVEIGQQKGTDDIHVRKTPSSTAEEITVIAEGTVVRISDFSDGWGYAPEYGGWVNLRYMTPCTEEG